MEWLCSRKGPSGNWQEHGTEDDHRKVAGASFMVEKQFSVVHQLRLVNSKDGKNQAIDRFPFFFIRILKIYRICRILIPPHEFSSTL
jgi:hypothetical protein